MKDSDIYLPGTHWTKISRRDLLRSGAAAGALWAVRSPATGFRSAMPRSQLSAGSGFVTPFCEWLADPLGIHQQNPRLSWRFPEMKAGLDQAAYQIIVSSTPEGSPDLWDSGEIESAEVAVIYRGSPLHAHQQAYWRVKTWLSDGNILPWSRTARWSMGPRNEDEWRASRWIGRDDLLETTQAQMPGVPGLPKEPNFFPAPHLRKEFSIRGPVQSALLYVCGLGYAEVHLNGQKVGNTERDPGFTNYNDRVLYVTHDIANRLHTGTNAIGAILGTGWYDVHDVATWHFNTASWRQRPRMRLLLVISYPDGSTDIVTSDQSWCCAAGPILRDGIYTGEVYDARNELLGWDIPGFDAKSWTPALCVEPPRGGLVPVTCEPTRVTQDLTPISITRPNPGVYIIDMGQNFSGHAQLRVRGPRGQTITMRYAEMLHDDGTLNAQPIDHFMEPTMPRQPFQQDTYICKGSDQDEIWEQRFSYAGFRYVEVTGFPGVPTTENFRGRFAHTDLARAGHFHCSDETMNRIQHAAIWSYLSNAQGYPTDCPQREKNGWTGDAGLACECGLMNFHSAAFYRKWLDDFADSQRPDGGFPVIVPNGGWGNGESWPGELTPPWDAAYPVILSNLYRHTGDRRVLESHVKHLRRYVEFFLNQRRNNGLAAGLGLGDWSPWKTETPLDYLTNAYLFYDLALLAKMLETLGDSKVSQRYASLAQETATAIHQVYYDPSARRYANGSQTAQSTALYFGFVPASERAGVLDELVQQVEQLGNIDVGVLGAKHLLRALSEAGRTDLAFRLATQKEMPGWGYWVNGGGATTLWEGWKKGASLNHIMFGDVSAWAYQWLAGIQQESDSIGFDRTVFRPNPVPGLTHLAASYEAPKGQIAIEWTFELNRLHFSVKVPCGVSARLVLPAGCRFTDSKSVTEIALSPGTHRIEALFD